ncbi:MAG: amidohydrolase [Chitinophagaceae bacterium]|nr:amidohydrolase [Chitinophagaceae bacterium]
MAQEKIFFNGNILTQDKSQSLATAFAVADGKIIGAGSDESILRIFNEHCERIDLQGATVLPGFNDAHIHIWKVGNLMTYMLDLRGVQSMDEMKQRLSDYAKQNPDLEWIQARGFNEVLFADKRMPNRFDLDGIISDRPVSVIRTCAHQLIVNTKALNVSGVTIQTPIPQGGEIKLLPDGNLAGHFTETAMGLVMNKVPSYGANHYRKMILAAQDEFLKVGITSATDPAVMPDLLEVYKSMDRNSELKIRVNAIPIIVPDGAAEPLPLPEKYQSDHLKVDTVKFFSDGGLSGKTAAMKKPYRNSEDYGVLRLTKDFFLPLAREAQEHGFRIATHAIGDAAIDLVLDVYEKIASLNKNNIRHRIEHLGLPSVENLELMHAMQVSAVMQPIFIYELGKNFRQYLSDTYLEEVYPARSVLNHKINLSFSTDAPVVKDFNPFTGLRSAVDRHDADGQPIAAHQKITVGEGIYAYTMGSAVANGDEQNRGSISPGKWADFIVLNKDVSKLSTDEISKCQAQQTYINGICQFLIPNS